MPNIVDKLTSTQGKYVPTSCTNISKLVLWLFMQLTYYNHQSFSTLAIHCWLEYRLKIAVSEPKTAELHKSRSRMHVIHSVISPFSSMDNSSHSSLTKLAQGCNFLAGRIFLGMFLKETLTLSPLRFSTLFEFGIFKFIIFFDQPYVDIISIPIVPKRNKHMYTQMQ